MATLELRQIEKTFPDGTRAVRDLSLSVADGELLVLLGPSGCGKSTVMRMIAGLEEVTAGAVLIGNERVNERTPQARNVAMVFQNYALYPHMSVGDNLAFPLRMRRMPRNEIRQRVQEAARLLGLGEVLDRFPRQLSGGQRQRVAMGRAIVREPAIFLLDEPLSNLDAKLRVQIRAEIAALQRRLRATTLYVTHDQVEALTLGHRVAVMRAGQLQQLAEPATLYQRPANAFVAGFLGSPPMNVFRVRWAPSPRPTALALGDQWLPLPTGGRPDSQGAQAPALAGIRPEALAPAQQAPSDWPRLQARVSMVERLGHEQVVYLDLPAGLVDTDRDDLGPSDSARFAARLPSGSAYQAGTILELAVDPEQIYWFDQQGRSLDRT